MTTKHVSINTLIDRIKRHPLLKDISTESIIDYTMDFVELVGVPSMFVNGVSTIKVKDYRGQLPDNLVSIIQVREGKCIYNISTDSFFLSDNNNEAGNTYKQQGGFIFLSKKEAEIEISYTAIPIGNDGVPLVPDNSSFLRAAEAYVKKMYFTILLDTGKIHPTVLQNAQQEYAWAVGDCQSEFNRLTIDEMHHLGNMWRGFTTGINKHKTGFK